MKKGTLKPRVKTPRGNFIRAAKQVIPFVSKFGEKFIEGLTDGTIVSDLEPFSEVADVYDWTSRTGFQVKMCNRRHAQRPTGLQIDRMHSLTKSDERPFVADIRKGLYALVFYAGVKPDGKSKLLEKEMEPESRQELIAREIQKVYLIEVDLLRHLSTSSDFRHIQKYGNCRVHDERKIHIRRDRLVLYLTRQFLADFTAHKIPTHLKAALRASFGKGGWCVKTTPTRIEFQGLLKFKKEIPVHFIGRPNTLESITIKPEVEFDMRDLT